jgi:hypothetical protein
MSFVSSMNIARSLAIFKYDVPLSLQNLSSGMNWTINIIDDVLKQRNIRHINTLHLYPRLLEFYNIGYTEKWIRRIDENFLEYDSGVKPIINVPRQRLPANFKYLYIKSFSGDVSGMIAESLFIYFLYSLGVKINGIGHLRPHKRGRSSFFPDYAIWDTSKAIALVLSVNNYSLPILAEVKGSTSTASRRELAQRLVKALIQLNYFISEPDQCGLVFLLCKKPTYEGIFFEVLP